MKPAATPTLWSGPSGGRASAVRSGASLGRGRAGDQSGLGPSSRAWRDALVAYGQELARGVEGELPIVAVDTGLGDLAHRMGLSAIARRGLTAMYALYLVGEPCLAIARLAKTLGDWTEPLGQGQLAALAMIERSGGKLRLAPAVTDLIDGDIGDDEEG